MSTGFLELNCIHEPYFVVDSELRFRFANSIYLHMVGRPQENLEGREFLTIHPSSESSQFYRQIKRSLETGVAQTAEDYLPDLQVWVEIRTWPLASGLGVLMFDITPRKQNEVALKASEDRARSMLEGSGMALARMALDGRLLGVNRRCTEVSGYHEYELLQKNFADLCLSAEVEADRKKFAVLISGQENSWTRERLLIRADGSECWVYMNITLVRGPSGAPKFFVLAFDDIAARKEAEESLQFALDAAGMAEWDYDAIQNETRRSPRFDQIFGYQTPLAQWGFAELIAHTHSEDRELVLTRFKDALAGGGNFSCESRIVWPDGSIHWVFLRGRTYLNLQGRAIRMAGLVMDITRDKQNERDLQMAKLAAEDANREKSYFLANMSHEIRTPLGAILGFSEALRDPQLDEEERLKYLNIITRNGHGLSALIDDILDLSKVEAGYLEVERVPVRVHELVNEVLSLLRVSASAKGLDLKIDFLGKLPTYVQTDPIRLRQILLNIVGNAIKFTQKGSVKVSVATEKQNLIFTVADTGPGISVAQSARLFQPFTQADNSTTRKYGGTGLGLALSRRLARAMGGDLYLCRSELGQGSTFAFQIAFEPVAASALPKTSAKDSLHKVNSALHSMIGLKILLAEDSPDNQELIKRLLDKRGAETQFADDGQAAVERALSEEFDLILMDMQMPRLDGYEATRELRRHGFAKPIVALTANAMRHDREKCIQAGCSDYLSKPIDPLKLYTLIGTLS